MRLIITRHCQTKWNREDRLQDRADNPLSKKGLHQAKMLAKRLRNENMSTKLGNASLSILEINGNKAYMKLFNSKS